MLHHRGLKGRVELLSTGHVARRAEKLSFEVIYIQISTRGHDLTRHSCIGVDEFLKTP